LRCKRVFFCSVLGFFVSQRTLLISGYTDSTAEVFPAVVPLSLAATLVEQMRVWEIGVQFELKTQAEKVGLIKGAGEEEGWWRRRSRRRRKR
jgi:hypothetical protein